MKAAEAELPDDVDGAMTGAILLVDPSLFTAPYDTQLSHALTGIGLTPIWATRQLRRDEEDHLVGCGEVLRLFYPLTDGPRRRKGKVAQIVKGVEHFQGLRRLAAIVRKRRPAIVHLQWSLVPLLDRQAIRRFQRTAPVVLTVHDVEPFNGKAVSAVQRRGFVATLKTVDRLIVHTAAGRDALVAQGVAQARIAIVPHGLLGAGAAHPAPEAAHARWTIVQFGKIQSYKGVDLLIEALGQMTARDRAALRVIVAGEPLIDIAPLQRRAEALGLTDTIDWRTHYHSLEEVDAVLGDADTFVFPYRAIEASGVFMLVAARKRWIVASDLGAFADLIGRNGDAGELVPVDNAEALAAALLRSTGQRPTRVIADAIPSWSEIGRMTGAAYAQAARDWRVRAAVN